MSYTPTTWTTGDTITATAMNKIENGIADAGETACVIVDFRDGGISGTVGCAVGYAKYISGRASYSIESPFYESWSNNFTGCLILSVALPNANSDLKPYILFSSYIDNIAAYQITGNISSTKVEAHEKVNGDSWSSETFYGFEVLGNGKIEVSYND